MATEITQDDFATIAAAALVKSGVDEGTLSLDRAHYALVVKDGLGRPLNTIYLANFYDRHIASVNEEVDLLPFLREGDSG